MVLGRVEGTLVGQVAVRELRSPLPHRIGGMPVTVVFERGARVVPVGQRPLSGYRRSAGPSQPREPACSQVQRLASDIWAEPGGAASAAA